MYQQIQQLISQPGFFAGAMAAVIATLAVLIALNAIGARLDRHERETRAMPGTGWNGQERRTHRGPLSSRQQAALRARSEVAYGPRDAATGRTKRAELRSAPR